MGVFSAYILTMSPRDILDRFFQLPNPQIRTALAGPPLSDEHPLAAEAARVEADAAPEVLRSEPSDRPSVEK
jgi:hypothetical protein